MRSMSERPLRNRLIRNTAFGMASHVWNLLVAFVVTPILIHAASMELYGVFAFFGALLAWTWILDLGIAEPTVRSLSRLAAVRDDAGFNRVISTMLIVKVIGGSILVASSFLFAGVLVRALGFPEPSISVRACQLMTMAFVLSNLAGVPAAGLAGTQRADLVYIGFLATSIPGTILAAALLLQGAGLLTFLWIQIASAGGTLLIDAFLFARFVPWGRLSPALAGGRELSELLRFARAMTFIRLTDTFFFNADRVTLGALSGSPQLVSYYQLGSSIATKAREGTQTLLGSSMPAAADLHSRGETDALAKLVRRGTRYVCLLAAPIYLFAIVFAEEALRLWLGQVPPGSPTVLRILAVGHFLAVLSSPVQTIGIAAGRIRLQVAAGLTGIIASLAAYVLIGRYHGLPGLAASVAVGLAISGILYLALFVRAFPKMLSAGSILRPLAATLAAGVVLAPAKWLIVTRHWAETRGSAALSLTASALAAFALLWVIGRALQAIESYDLDTFLRRAP